MRHRGHAARGLAAFVLLAVGGPTACNSITGAGSLVVDTGGASTGGSSNTGGQGSGGSTRATSSSGGTSGKTSSGVSSSGATSTSSSTSSTSSSSSSSGSSTDPTQLCVDTINMFRATRNLPPYTRDTSEEACVSTEATTDGMKMSAHWDFINNNAPCSSNAENECPGWSDNPLDPTEGIVACLTSMWNEKNQAACSGCDTCDFPYNNCTNCVFENGTTQCGHYLNMKSAVLTKVACGFWSMGWYTQDFWP